MDLEGVGVEGWAEVAADDAVKGLVGEEEAGVEACVAVGAEGWAGVVGLLAEAGVLGEAELALVGGDTAKSWVN